MTEDLINKKIKITPETYTIIYMTEDLRKKKIWKKSKKDGEIIILMKNLKS